jgi:hypothetical protein
MAGSRTKPVGQAEKTRRMAGFFLPKQAYFFLVVAFTAFEVAVVAA